VQGFAKDSPIPDEVLLEIQQNIAAERATGGRESEGHFIALVDDDEISNIQDLVANFVGDLNAHRVEAYFGLPVQTAFRRCRRRGMGLCRRDFHECGRSDGKRLE